MLYQLSYFRIYKSLVGCKNRFLPPSCKDFLLVLGGVLGAFGHIDLGLAFVLHGIETITATHDKSEDGKKLNVEKKTGGRNPVSAKVFSIQRVLVIILHKCDLHRKNRKCSSIIHSRKKQFH